MQMPNKPVILYVWKATAASPDGDLPAVFRSAVEAVGELVVRSAADLSHSELCAAIRSSDVYLICRHSAMVPVEIAEDAGSLRLIVSAVGSLQPYVPRSVVASRVPVCNWGDAPAEEIASGTLTLLLATLADLHHHIVMRRRGIWKIDGEHHGGSLFGERVGLFGFGLIGRRFCELLAPFRCEVHVYDPYAVDLPSDVTKSESLDDLFTRCRIISIHAGLTDETRHSVTARHLALLADDAVIINTARGGIIDQDALFHELQSGRLRAGLDVLDDPDQVPVGHPSREWDNLILTGHQVSLGWPRHGRAPSELSKAQRYAVENITAVLRREPLKWLITLTQFDRMT